MDFSTIQQGLADKSFTLVDVRNPDEIKTSGKIPGSVNIPLPQLEEGLNLDSEAFQEKFGFDKPEQDEAIVAHCMRGARAVKAKEIFEAQGYNQVEIYPGSFADWQDQGGDIEKD